MSSILVRRANMVAGRLPAGYTELAYIQSTGTQYINTGIKPTTKSRWELDIMFGTGTVTSENWFNGVYANDSPVRRFDIALSTASILINAGAANEAGPLSDAKGIRQKYVLDVLNSKWSYGSTNGNYSSTFTKDFSYNVYICARNDWRNSSRAPSRFSSQKVYDSKLYQNNSLVQHLIPAMRDSDSAIGMYDLVSNTFLTNAGSGTFNYGTL